ncbi:serine hydrolase [Streptomyces sp. GC420]|uniref:serine hydrolase n=1 Tax=Streptomyces sp. GC420 TaxID=2697568 RepID=UPI001414EBA2|nr:serine hydrolase [Streptomyces sp. GC420]NBM17302.1 hypothetical protein [Streptomyces sp. GC420]
MSSPGPRGRRRRPRRTAVHLSVAAALLVTGSLAGTAYVTARDRSAAPPGAVSSSAPSAESAAAGTAPAGRSEAGGADAEAADGDGDEEERETAEVDLDGALARSLDSVAAGTDASLAVGLLDLETGAGASYGTDGERTYDTASIVKVDVLAALLLRAQEEGRELTAQERACASAMIRNSDNASTTTLWQVIGGADGLDAANERLGLSGTTAGRNDNWGLTRTTAADQLTLLSAVFADGGDGGSGGSSGSVLSEESRAYVGELMGGVAAGQDWGVSAAGSGARLKNGWLPRTATGLWDINSIGFVTVGGHRCLLAVLSEGHTTKEEGIALVEAAAKAAAGVVSG